MKILFKDVAIDEEFSFLHGLDNLYVKLNNQLWPADNCKVIKSKMNAYGSIVSAGADTEVLIEDDGELVP